ncbi:MAG: plasmid mobilization protein [Angustibacter sp.]
MAAANLPDGRSADPAVPADAGAGESADGGSGRAARQVQRRRRANVTGGRQHSHRVMVSPQEQALLVQRAAVQRVTVPRLLVEAALSGAAETPTQRREAMVELFRIHRLLGAISRNVNQLARATHATGQVPAETTVTLVKVREVADRIDRTIDELGGQLGR